MSEEKNNKIKKTLQKAGRNAAPFVSMPESGKGADAKNFEPKDDKPKKVKQESEELKNTEVENVNAEAAVQACGASSENLKPENVLGDKDENEVLAGEEVLQETQQDKPKTLKDKIEEAEIITEIIEENLPATATEVIREARIEVHRKSSRLMNYFYSMCLFINLISFSLFLFLQSGSAYSFKELTEKTDVLYLWLAVATFFVSMALEALRIWLLVLKSTKRSRPFTSYKTASIGKFYDYITPLSTGGQPFQVAYLNTRGIAGPRSSSVPMAKMIFGQFAYMLVLIVFFVVLRRTSGVFNQGGPFSTFIGVAAYVGLGIQLLWLIVVLSFSISRRLGPFITISVLKLLGKLKIVNYKKAYTNVLRFVREFQFTMRRYARDVLFFILMMLISVAIILIRASVPFLIYCAANGWNFGMWAEIVTRVLICELALGFWILPGNVIFADIAFMTLFSGVIIPRPVMFWALLIWRIVTYYVYILQGFLVMTYDKIKDAAKARRAKSIKKSKT